MKYIAMKRINEMGTVYAEITLKNAGDVCSVIRGFTEEKVRETTVRAVVDTGAGTLIITERLRQQLGLAVTGSREATLANEQKEICSVTEPVEVHWKDRETTCPSLVVSDDGDVLLGAIPLEDMDLIVNPAKREITGAHGDKVVCLLK
jgi:clan AA aspartic protease